VLIEVKVQAMFSILFWLAYSFLIFRGHLGQRCPLGWCCTFWNFAVILQYSSAFISGKQFEVCVYALTIFQFCLLPHLLPFTACFTLSRILWELTAKWALSLRVKRPGREADHSPPSSAEVKERVKLHLYSPNTPSWCGAQLKSAGTNLLNIF
jgi:hypothetical protein